MKNSFDLAVEISEEYDFNSDSLSTIEKNRWVKNQYPLVYFIKNNETKIAYVGESTNGLSRIKNHLSNPSRRNLNKISIIGSDKFNKSATLDIESKLIQYIQAEGSFELQNGNGGHTLHNYYQRDLYEKIFNEIWIKLLEKKLVCKTLEDVENSNLFKYSPYKSLNSDQYDSILKIIEALTSDTESTVMIDGSAGTGKTVLATYLIKLLVSDFREDEDSLYNEDAIREITVLKKFKEKYPTPRIGFVIAMSSLRETMEKVFHSVPGLRKSMVISPSETFKKDYDILIVDESHRLRRYKNISWRGAFKANNLKLNLDHKTGHELDWIMANGKKQVLFYDEKQSVKPSDIPQHYFDSLKEKSSTVKLSLKSQMRVKAGNDYIAFVDHLLNLESEDLKKYTIENYELLLFDSLKDLYRELEIRNKQFGLARLVSGYSWEWKSDPKRKPVPDLNAIDIELDGLQFQWNRTDKDWIASPTSFEEIGCIHTTQGYDLNYAGVIFGKEIILNPETNQIEIIAENYFDQYGKDATEYDELREYIINIYKTLMYRGQRGTFVYVCDENLRNFLKQHIQVYQKTSPFRVIEPKNVKPYINSIPVYDLKASAGDFSDFQNPEELEWVELPPNISPQKGMFICQVIGESMNQVIPNGSWCLFKADPGGSRNGLITLVQMMNYTDPDYGSNYTIKEYSSKKTYSGETWEHDEIRLTPKSTEVIEPTVLKKDEMIEWRVVGVFVRVLENT